MEYKSLVSEIESYLKSLLRESPDGWIELSRKEIAAFFDCVPSQITYVLNTRFNMRRGYLVQSRRGGGGFIRICSLFTAPETVFVEPKVEKKEDDARGTLYALARGGLLTKREFLILGTALEVLDNNFPGEEGGKLLLEILRALAQEGLFHR